MKRKADILGMFRARWLLGFPVLIAVLMIVTACTTTGANPPLADIQAVTEAKPRPTAAILTDPAADARYNASIEATLDRVHAAAMRLCRFYARTGMDGVECSGE